MNVLLYIVTIMALCGSGVLWGVGEEKGSFAIMFLGILLGAVGVACAIMQCGG